MQIISKIIAISGILTILLFGILGIGMGMNSRGHNAMAVCPFLMGESSLCPMDFSNHIDAWQNMFLANISPMLFFVILAVGLIFFRFDFFLLPRIQRFLLYFQKQQKNFLFYFPLFKSLRRGIIEPKLFA